MRCPECGREMRLLKEESVESFKGSQVRLSYDVYRCDGCGSSYVDARSLDEAWKKIWDDYEKANCVPSPDDRDRIVGKTNIGNESRLSLRERMIIEAHGNTETHLNGFKVFSGRTLSAVVGSFLSEIGPLDHMKLFKLLFYSDSLSFERRGISITGLRHIANQYGPTPVKYEDVVSYLKESGVVEEGKKAFVMIKGTATTDHLLVEEEEIIETVVKAYGRLTSKKLSSLSHEEPCWKETEEKKVIKYCKGVNDPRLKPGASSSG